MKKKKKKAGISTSRKEREKERKKGGEKRHFAKSGGWEGYGKRKKGSKP